MDKPVNPKLTYEQCREMVKRISLANTLHEMSERCLIAENWIKANTIITNEQYNFLMRWVSDTYRDSLHPERWNIGDQE